MAFALTTSDFALQEDTLLVAWVYKDEDTWVQSRIDLNEYIGCYNGEFDVASSGWFGWSRPGSSYLQGTVLFAQLMKPNGSWGPKTSIDLNIFIKNDNGTLKFQKLHDSITASSACLNLSNSVLQGLCFGYDGKLHYSEIDLDNHFGNIEGRIEPGSSHLFKTGDEFQLCPSPVDVRLRGRLQCHPRWRPKSRRRSNDMAWNRHDLDIAQSVRNKDGRFEFFRRAEKSNRICEPGNLLQDNTRIRCTLGGAELVSGNEDQVAEEIAECTSSSIAAIGILVGATIGTITGNSMIGLAIGTGMAAPGAISPEIESLVTCINDPLILARSLEAAIGRYLYRSLRNLLSLDATEFFVDFMNARLDPKIDEIGNTVLDCLGAASISRGAGISLEAAIAR
ncbi:hypothetical protein TWF718_005137 [Orbilia javanica]|uniref:Cyanovirin-N domain-containing protein n=1 Tax=Orbilia javanica TaxID=47235 RepID=A0AAN8N6V7_9PEZI